MPENGISLKLKSDVSVSKKNITEPFKEPEKKQINYRYIKFRTTTQEGLKFSMIGSRYTIGCIMSKFSRTLTKLNHQ